MIKTKFFVVFICLSLQVHFTGHEFLVYSSPHGRIFNLSIMILYHKLGNFPLDLGAGLGIEVRGGGCNFMRQTILEEVFLINIHDNALRLSVRFPGVRKIFIDLDLIAIPKFVCSIEI